MGHLSGEQLRLGRIEFLNVLPIYYPLETGIIPHPFSIVSGTPSYLNGLMAQGDLDLSVVSSIEYARHPERYFILPDLSISCLGSVKSVLLLSRVPVEQLGGRAILASTQSHTSVALLKVLFSNFFGTKAIIEPGNCTETLSRGIQPEGILAIGDEALRLRSHPHYPYVMDLGEAWHNRTGLPFVFALWVIQRKALDKWNGELGSAIKAIIAAKHWGLTHLDCICSEAQQKGLLSVAELHEYYRCLHFDLTQKEQQGLELFYRHLFQIGEICGYPGLDICSLLASVA